MGRSRSRIYLHYPISVVCPESGSYHVVQVGHIAGRTRPPPSVVDDISDPQPRGPTFEYCPTQQTSLQSDTGTGLFGNVSLHSLKKSILLFLYHTLILLTKLFIKTLNISK